MKIPALFLNPIIQKISAALISTLGIILLILGMQKEITLVVNGDAQQITTYALTVRGVLRSQDYLLSEQDHIYPSPGAWIWRDGTIYYRVSSAIEIQADGELLSLQTAEIRPENVLLEAGFTVFPKDRIVVDGKLINEDTLLAAGKNHVIQILRGTPITVLTESGTIQFISDGDRLGEAFEKEAIKVLDTDELSLPLDTPLDGSSIKVEWIQSKPLLVQLADQSITILTTSETIGLALAKAGIALQGMDYSEPAETESIPENRQVQIIRVREEVLLNQETIPFQTTYSPDDSSELDQLSILSGGEYGINAQQVRVTYENEQEISREVEKEWVLREPSPRVLGYGTQINLRTADTQDGQITYWRKITAYATSYNENCEGCKTYTATGAPLKKGVIAVKLDWFLYMKHLKVYIPGYGFASIEDVGGGVPWSTNWVDLGYKAINYEPWYWYVDVYFLAPPPPPEDIMYILY
jgi:uncharacterized protein YabE (DUF348 family)